MVKRLYDIVLLFKEYVVVSFCLLVSILLLALNDTPQIRVLRSYAVVGVGLLQNAVSFLPNYFSLSQENAALRTMNLALADEVSRLREGKLDAGEQEGVRVSMPIVSESGLVGKIISTSGHYAIGQILLNRDLRVSAKVQRSRVDGVVRWDGGTTLQLREVARTMDVQQGDLVVTSEYSAYYPEGTRIGVVSRAEPIPGSLFLSVEVAPSVDFTRLEEVFVLVHQPDSARIALEHRSR
jgi:rod shape-determining protein MreC